MLRQVPRELITMGVPKVPCELTDDNYIFILKEYSEGASDTEIKAYIWEERGTFSNDLWDRWIKEEPVFSEAIKKGRALSARWWERNGRKNMYDSSFNYTGWYMNMKNRFGWRDKTEETGKTETTTTIISATPLTSKEWEEEHGK